MFKSVLYTILSKFFIALLNVFLVVITSRFYNADGRGFYSWWILNITFITHLSGIIGGSSWVYFASRYSLRNNFLMSYIWALISSTLISCILLFSNKIEYSFFYHLLFLGCIDSILGNTLFYFQGKNKIRYFNFIQVLNMILLCFFFMLFYFLGFSLEETTIYSLYSSKIFTLIPALYLQYSIPDNSTNSYDKINLLEFIRFSSVIQFGNVIQFINYRFTFYFLEHYYTGNLKFLGVFSSAISIAEGLWLVNRSISAIHYSNVANTNNLSENIEKTIVLIRYTFIIMSVLVLLLILVPAKVFTWLLGQDFLLTKDILLLLSPGIIIFSISGLISHFFAGIGKNKYNVLSSLFSTIFTLFFGVILIKKFHIFGAAITNVLSYFFSVAVLIYFFTKKNKVSIKKILPTWADVKNLQAMFFRIIKY